MQLKRLKHSSKWFMKHASLFSILGVGVVKNGGVRIFTRW